MSDKLKKISQEKKPEFFDPSLVKVEREKKIAGRPKKIEGEAVRATIVLSEKIMTDIKKKIEIHGSVSEYVRYLIEKDLKNGL
jgi:predicted DNA binding CopG/RHH family protein